jgi:hypothetical protein
MWKKEILLYGYTEGADSQFLRNHGNYTMFINQELYIQILISENFKSCLEIAFEMNAALRSEAFLDHATSMFAREPFNTGPQSFIRNSLGPDVFRNSECIGF